MNKTIKISAEALKKLEEHVPTKDQLKDLKRKVEITENEFEKAKENADKYGLLIAEALGTKYDQHLEELFNSKNYSELGKALLDKPDVYKSYFIDKFRSKSLEPFNYEILCEIGIDKWEPDLAAKAFITILDNEFPEKEWEENEEEEEEIEEENLAEEIEMGDEDYKKIKENLVDLANRISENGKEVPAELLNFISDNRFQKVIALLNINELHQLNFRDSKFGYLADEVRDYLRSIMPNFIEKFGVTCVSAVEIGFIADWLIASGSLQRLIESLEQGNDNDSLTYFKFIQQKQTLLLQGMKQREDLYSCLEKICFDSLNSVTWLFDELKLKLEDLPEELCFHIYSSIARVDLHNNTYNSVLTFLEQKQIEPGQIKKIKSLRAIYLKNEYRKFNYDAGIGIDGNIAKNSIYYGGWNVLEEYWTNLDDETKLGLLGYYFEMSKGDRYEPGKEIGQDLLKKLLEQFNFTSITNEQFLRFIRICTQIVDDCNADKIFELMGEQNQAVKINSIEIDRNQMNTIIDCMKNDLSSISEELPQAVIFELFKMKNNYLYTQDDLSKAPNFDNWPDEIKQEAVALSLEEQINNGSIDALLACSGKKIKCVLDISKSFELKDENLGNTLNECFGLKHNQVTAEVVDENKDEINTQSENSNKSLNDVQALRRKSSNLRNAVKSLASATVVSTLALGLLHFIAPPIALLIDASVAGVFLVATIACVIAKNVVDKNIDACVVKGEDKSDGGNTYEEPGQQKQKENQILKTPISERITSNNTLNPKPKSESTNLEKDISEDSVINIG